MPKLTDLSADDYEEVRDNVVLNCKEGVTPETSLPDWGDFNQDHSSQDHHESFGDAETFYHDHHQPEDISIEA
jgi:hypothetical protein